MMKLKIVRGKAGKVRIYTSILVFLLISLVIHVMFPLFTGLSNHKIPNLKTMMFHLMEFKYIKIWLYSEALAIAVALYVWIIGDKQYVSDLIQVTDKIRIPVPAGQGQFGSARFATEKEVEEFLDYVDFKLSDYDDEFCQVYKMNEAEEAELSKITAEELDSYEEQEQNVGTLLESEADVNKRNKNIEEIIEVLGNRKDIRYILKSNLSINDLKQSEIKDIEFDEYYAKLTQPEFNEVVIAVNKVSNVLKRNLIYEYMVKRRYESIDQLREIRYAIEDGISGGHIQLFALNIYGADKLKQIRLAYKSDKIQNKRLIEKYMLNPRLTRNQMEEIRKALMQDIDNIEGIAHDEIPEELMRRLREISLNLSDNDKKVSSSTDTSIKRHKAAYDIKKESKEVVQLFNKGGLVLGKENLSNGKERILSVNDDLHTLTIGETGSGKTRTMVLQSIVNLGLAGENMVVTDIKGELSDFTAEFLRRIGYLVVYLDFKNPLKSTRVNFLKPVIDAVNKDDIDGAVELTWDITSQLVGEVKGEPIWQNGEAAIIAGAIMAVVYDNKHRPEYQNFANVYNFLAEMCKPIQIGKEMVLPINEYSKNLDEHHPAKGLFAIGEIAPSRTRGSFYTSALTTLKLFTSQRLADMTSQSEFELKHLATKKMAVFIILPEDRDTYNQIAALYVGLQYQALSKMADLAGGRLKRRCNFLLDEFGNFPAIPNFLQMITVSRGKGVRFNLFLQDLSQLVKIYGKEGADTIYGNCPIWIYLRTGNKETLELLSAKLSQYTVSSYSLSGSTEVNKNANSSFSKQLSGRNLLQVNELALFSSPYLLMFSKINPAVLKSDDFSKWQYVKLLNMGSKERDRKLRYYRQSIRKEHLPNRQEYWNIKDETISNIMLGGQGYV